MWHNRKVAGLKLYRDILLTKLHRSDSILSAAVLLYLLLLPLRRLPITAFGARF